ncbi:hypothetical protein LPV64_02550, partial [Ralstonia pseudosolanacearum]|nr:hypothetical protein [Ralstonia pseudosolanacearum]
MQQRHGIIEEIEQAIAQFDIPRDHLYEEVFGWIGMNYLGLLRASICRHLSPPRMTTISFFDHILAPDIAL